MENVHTLNKNVFSISMLNYNTVFLTPYNIYFFFKISYFYLSYYTIDTKVTMHV